MTIPTEVAQGAHLEEAYKAVKALVEFAYEQGFHEMGYQPEEVLYKSALTKAEAVAYTVRCVHETTATPEGIYFLEVKADVAPLAGTKLYAHAPPALPVASVPDGFYLASFKHKDRGGAMMWWGPDNAGYTPDIEQAGIYTEITPGYHDSDHTVPVPVGFLAGCRIRRTLDPGDSKNRAFWSAADLRAAVATNQEGAAP